MFEQVTYIANGRIPVGFGALKGELGRVLFSLTELAAQHRVTGVFGWDSGVFLMVFEGEPAAVKAMEDALASRHARLPLVRVGENPVSRREFETFRIAGFRQPLETGLIRSMKTVMPTAEAVHSHVCRMVARSVFSETARFAEYA